MARSSTALRYFIVGETVHLRSRISEPGGRKPVDPDTVALTFLGLEGGASVLTEPLPLTREVEGEWVLAIPTVDLAPGVYTLAVTHADGPSKVTVATDQFVLRAV